MHFVRCWKCSVLTGSSENTNVAEDYVWTTRSTSAIPSPSSLSSRGETLFVPEPQSREIGKSEVTFTFTTFPRKVFPRVRPIYYIKMRYSLQQANLEAARGVLCSRLSTCTRDLRTLKRTSWKVKVVPGCAAFQTFQRMQYYFCSPKNFVLI